MTVELQSIRAILVSRIDPLTCLNPSHSPGWQALTTRKRDGQGGILGSSVLGVTLVVQTSASVHQGKQGFEETVGVHLQSSFRLVSVFGGEK
jgi:hypothetical protein